MSFKGLVENLIDILNATVIPALFALAFVALLFGIFRYFFFQSEENLQKGRQLVLWGGIAFIVMLSIWGILAIILNTLQF